MIWLNVYDVFMFLTFCINGRLNPQNEAAKRGLERLEKQMKVCSFYSFTQFRAWSRLTLKFDRQFCDFAFVQGVDPDAPEEDEDNDVEDGDGDQDETELL